jgi:hypothetical protein
MAGAEKNFKAGPTAWWIIIEFLVRSPEYLGFSTKSGPLGFTFRAGPQQGYWLYLLFGPSGPVQAGRGNCSPPNPGPPSMCRSRCRRADWRSGIPRRWRGVGRCRTTDSRSAPSGQRAASGWCGPRSSRDEGSRFSDPNPGFQNVLFRELRFAMGIPPCRRRPSRFSSTISTPR